MDTEILPGSLADATFSGLPQDGERQIADPIRTEKAEKQPEVQKQEKKEVAPEVEKVEKEEVSEETENPYLSDAGKKEEKREEIASEEMPADLKKGMTGPAAAKAEKAWKSIMAREQEWKGKADAAQKALATHTEELAGVKKQLTDLQGMKEELERARKELQGYESEISVTRVEATKPFKSQVTEPRSRITSAVERIAGKYQVSPDALMRIVQEKDEAKQDDELNDVISDFKPSHQHEMTMAAQEWRRTEATAAEMRANAGEKLKQLTEAEKAQRDRDNSAHTDMYRSHVAEEFSQVQNLIPYLRPVEGNQKWNDYLATINRDAAAVDINDLPVGSVAKAIVSARVLPDVLKLAKHFEAKSKDLATKLAAAEKQLEDRRKLSAPAGGGNNGGETKSNRGNGSMADSVFPAE